MSIEGLDGLNNLLDDLPEVMLDAAEKGLKAALKLPVAEAKNLAPVDDGQLRNSITSAVLRQGNALEGQVVAMAEYAAYDELGTGERGRASDNGKAPGVATYTEGHAGMAARPFLYPAWKANEEKMLGIVAEAAGKLGGGL